MDLTASSRLDRNFFLCACGVILSLWDDPTTALASCQACLACQSTVWGHPGTVSWGYSLAHLSSSLNLRLPWSGLMPPKHDLSLHMRSGLFSRKSLHWWKTNKEIRKTLDKLKLNSHERRWQKCKWFDQDAVFTLCENSSLCPHCDMFVLL